MHRANWWGIPARRFFGLSTLFCLCFTVPSVKAQLPSIPTGPISIEVESVASGLNGPLEFVPVNDGSGRLFIVEQGGRIRLLKNGAVYATPVLEISAIIKVGGEQGLLGLAFHPGFANSGSPGFRKLYTYANLQPEWRRRFHRAEGERVRESMRRDGMADFGSEPGYRRPAKQSQPSFAPSLPETTPRLCVGPGTLPGLPWSKFTA
ncbi:MAG: PQQ-dependent sugar dehydrogenase [Chthoniobacterales bacterium]|nr:PQQ-dependent sugar dehydrogenase [Chthoniobacterales bacterium]